MRAYAEANYGRVLLLDQCEECGGVWFDRWELYFASTGSLLSLAAVDGRRFAAPNLGAKGAGECPRCAVELKPFVDPALPPDASISRCERCRGLWLNRGDLARYADFKALKTGGSTRVPAPGEMKALEHLQKALNTSTLLDAPPPPGLSGAEASIEPREVLKDMGFLALQALIRLVFKF